MIDHNVQIDASKVHELLDGLTGKEVHSVWVRAARKAAKKLQRQTEANFSRLIVKNPGGKGSLTNSSKGYGKVATIKVYAKALSPYAVVSTASKKADFRARFFEIGTKPRYRGASSIRSRRYAKTVGRITKLRDRKRATWYTGVIMEGRYFVRAQKETEAQVFREMREDAIKIIKQVWKKRQQSQSAK